MFEHVEIRKEILRERKAKEMNNDYVIERKLGELIRQQKITNVYLKELTEQGIRHSSVSSKYYIDKLQNEVYKQ